MMEITNEGVVARFRKHREEIAQAGPEERRLLILTNAVLGIGFLLGGGCPASAAALAFALERELPDQAWPWTESAS
jgi:hypothetical protein